MTTETAHNLKEAKPKDAADTYVEGVGRRKNAVARVRIYESKAADYTINGRKLEDHFPLEIEQHTVTEPVTAAETQTTFFVSALVRGGGPSAQAEAVRHGLARALVAYDPELRPTLKKAGYLKRDPREVERKKFGLRKARKREQWSKR